MGIIDYTSILAKIRSWLCIIIPARLGKRVKPIALINTYYSLSSPIHNNFTSNFFYKGNLRSSFLKPAGFVNSVVILKLKQQLRRHPEQEFSSISYIITDNSSKKATPFRPWLSWLHLNYSVSTRFSAWLYD